MKINGFTKAIVYFIECEAGILLRFKLDTPLFSISVTLNTILM